MRQFKNCLRTGKLKKFRTTKEKIKAEIRAAEENLKVAIDELYVKEEILEPKLIEYFEEAMGLREAADYQSIFSKDGALWAIKEAKEFLKQTRKVIEQCP